MAQLSSDTKDPGQGEETMGEEDPNDQSYWVPVTVMNLNKYMRRDAYICVERQGPGDILFMFMFHIVHERKQ